MPWRDLPPTIDADEARELTADVPRPVAVTGATGFIGSHVLDVLALARVPCRVLARDPGRLRVSAETIEVVTGDLESPKALEQLIAGCPVVVHLAGVVRAGRPTVFDRVNRQGTEAVLAATRSNPRCHVVLVSSQAAAGPSPSSAGRSPEDPATPVSAYGRSKLAAEELVRRRSGSAWTIVRPPAVYGPRDVDVFQFFRLAARGVVPVPAGERWVTMAHVTDVVRGTLRASSGLAAREVLHLGHPTPMTIRELVRRLAEAGGVRVRVLSLPPWVVRVAGLSGNLLQFMGRRSVAMTSDKARELLARHWTLETEGSMAALGLDGAVPFAAGAAAAWDWYRAEGWLHRGTIPPV